MVIVALPEVSPAAAAVTVTTPALSVDCNAVVAIPSTPATVAGPDMEPNSAPLSIEKTMSAGATSVLPFTSNSVAVSVDVDTPSAVSIAGEATSPTFVAWTSIVIVWPGGSSGPIAPLVNEI